MISRDTDSRFFCPCIMRENLREVGLEPVLLGVLLRRLRRLTIIWLMLSLSAATSPCASTSIDRVRSPLVTAVATSEIARTCVVRLPASWLTLSVSSRQVPDGARHLRLAAELALDADLARHRA